MRFGENNEERRKIKGIAIAEREIQLNGRVSLPLLKERMVHAKRERSTIKDIRISLLYEKDIREDGIKNIGKRKTRATIRK